MHSDRKEFIKNVGLGLGATALAGCTTSSNSLYPKNQGKLPQVIAAWPFMAAGQKWDAKTFVHYVHQLGVAGVELLDVEHWHLLKKHNLICAATKSHTFIRGMNNKGHHAECMTKLESAIEATSSAGFKNVMTFTGMTDTRQEKNGSLVSLEKGIANCVEGYKKIVRLAEKKKVQLVLEPLNTRDSTHMKGHPGYMGDRLDICLEILEKVASPSLRLLFDVYHIQIMEGDIIRNIQRCKDWIGHVQIAGVPGRGEIGANQEVNYKAIMHAFYNNGYRDAIGHEWIPTLDPLTGLKEAIDICTIH